MQKGKKFVVVMVIMLLLSVPLFAMSAAALTTDDIPGDILINPRPLNKDGGYTNYIYMEYNFPSPYPEDLGHRIYVKRYMCTKNNDFIIEFGLWGSSYGFRFTYTGGSVTASGSEYDSYANITNLKKSLTTSGETNAVKTYAGTTSANFVITKLLYSSTGIMVTKDGQPQSQIGALELPGLMSTMQNGVTILQPQNGLKQSQIEVVSMQYAFKVPHRAGATKDDIKIKVDGYLKDGPYPPEVEHAEYEEQDGYAYGLYKVNGSVGFGEGKELKVTVTDSYGNKWFDTVTVSNFSDFVDEDGDGADDRAGDDYWDYSPIGYNKPDVKLQDLGNMISGVKGFFESLWGVLPTPVYVFLIGAIILLLAVGTLRAVLG